MRSSLKALVFALCSVGMLAAQSTDDAACLACHGKASAIKKGSGSSVFVDKAKYEASVHGANGCISCHADIAENPEHLKAPGKTPVKPVACAPCHEKSDKSFGRSAHATALKGGNSAAAQCADCHGKHEILPARSAGSPVSRAHLTDTCGKCHPEIVTEFQESTHGQAMAKGIKEAPSCTDCHSDHAIKDLRGLSPIKVAADVCADCHSSQKMNSKFDLPGNRVETFYQSYHGMAAKLGSSKTANCASCHGFHRILPSSDPKSMVHKDNLIKTCGKCHPGANEKFITGRMHSEGNEVTTLGDRVNTWVKTGYIAMILVVIGGMAAHNLMGLWRKARFAYRDADRTVVRMNLLARIQHAGLALSFIYLVLTGFALKYPDSWLGVIFGASEQWRRFGHRAAAVVMIALSVFHVFFVIFTKDGRKFVKDMWPEKKDLFDVVVNLRHFMDSKSPRPDLKRFGYAEKAEYWALVWGTIVMAVTGIMLWAKMWVTNYLPRWVVDVATTVHLYEAILATLAIIIWHFYFVIFDPDIYPMNWAWFDGRVNRDHYREEHPLDTPEDIGENPAAHKGGGKSKH